MTHLDETNVGDLLSAIAARTPTPGGGAVASITAAIGAALAAMVVHYSRTKKSLAEHADVHVAALATLDASRFTALELAEADARAYARLNALWKLPADDPARVDFPAAVRDAIDAPSRVLALCAEVTTCLEELCGRSNAMLASDLAIAAILTEAAARSAAWNVRVNLPSVDDDGERSTIESTTESLLEDLRVRSRAIEERCVAPA